MMMWIIDLSYRLSKECQQLLRQSISGASKRRRPLLLLLLQRCSLSYCSRLQTAAVITGRRTRPFLEQCCSGDDEEGRRCAFYTDITHKYIVAPTHTHTLANAQGGPTDELFTRWRGVGFAGSHISLWLQKYKTSLIKDEHPLGGTEAWGHVTGLMRPDEAVKWRER